MSIYLAGNPESRNVQYAQKDATTATEFATMAAFDSTTGLIEPVTATTTAPETYGIFTETVKAGQALTQVGVELKMAGAEYIVASTNNSDVAHNGQRMVATNAGAINNTGTDDAAGIVRQVGVVGVAADKLIKVIFV